LSGRDKYIPAIAVWGGELADTTARLGQQLPVIVAKEFRNVATELADSLAATQSGRDDIIRVRREAENSLEWVSRRSSRLSHFALSANIVLAYADTIHDSYFAHCLPYSSTAERNTLIMTAPKPPAISLREMWISLLQGQNPSFHDATTPRKAYYLYRAPQICGNPYRVPDRQCGLYVPHCACSGYNSN
jgi:hypothetical protein